ncbi:MAG: restriction endonuclease subunit S [Planctomycetaceae bacterium]|jgi:type I restriction enzyme S subunit/type I restriction enzyme M protein|nr:restriction endonuclease subunit S [Planctomycetaceae bacterium]
MKGLEASEITFSKYQETHRLRLDSDYYRKEFLENEKLLSSTYTIQAFCEETIPNIKNAGLKKSFLYLEISNVSLNNITYRTVEINPKEIPDRATYILQKNDVVVSTVRPNRNAVALIHNVDELLVGTSGFTVLRSKNISPYYLYAFCKTKHFITKLMRENTATMYPAVSDDDVLNVRLPLFSEKFRDKVSELVKKALECIKHTQRLYADAENVLLSALEAGNADRGTAINTRDNINVKPFSFASQTARLDAEYYLPKYEKFEKLITTYQYGYKPLDKVCRINDANFIPQNDTKYNYIELADVGKDGEITGATQEFGRNLPTRARRIVYKGDVIVSSIEGSLDSCALVTSQYDNAICSTGFYVISSDSINFETLLVLFKSELMQQLLKQNCSGTILTSINKDALYRLPIPLVSSKVQSEISSLVSSSFSLRSESEALLAEAKLMVEKAIEKRNGG